MVKIRSIGLGLRSKAYVSCFTKKNISPSFSQATYDAQTLLYNITQFLACLKRYVECLIYAMSIGKWLTYPKLTLFTIVEQFIWTENTGIGIIVAKYMHYNELLSYYYISTTHVVYHGYFSIYR